MEIDNYSIEQILDKRANSEQALQSVKIVDYEKVFNIIQEHNLQNCDIGLKEDWSCTAGELIEDDIVSEETYFYGKSTWATPILMDDKGNIYECWKFIPRDSQMGFEIPIWFRLSIIKRFMESHEESKQNIDTITELIDVIKGIENIINETQNEKLRKVFYNHIRIIIEKIAKLEEALKNDTDN